MTESLVNGAASTLNGLISNVATSIVIQTADMGKFPSSGTYRIVVSDTTNFEIMTVTAGWGTATLTVTRASEVYNGVQTAFGFASGSTVTPVLTVAGLQAYIANLTAVTNGSEVLLNYQQATDLANVTTISGSWVDSGVTHSFTVDDPNALIDIEINGNVVDGQASNHGVGSQLLIDGSTAKPLGGTYGAYGNFLTGAGTVTVGPLSVGVHTVKVQYGCDLGGTAQCRASTRAINGESYSARIVQRPQIQATPVGGTAGDKLLLEYIYTGADIAPQALTGDTWNDINAMSNQTFVVDDPSATIEVEVTGYSLVGDVNGFVAARLNVDSAGTPITKNFGGGTSTNTYANPLTGSTSLGALSSGSHTIKVQVNPSVGMNFYLRYSAGREFLSVRVWQRPTIYRGASVPGAQYSSTSARSVSGAWAALTLDTKAWDTDAMWAGGSPTRLTCHTAGKYVAHGMLVFSAAGDTGYISFNKNGAGLTGGVYNYAETGPINRASITYVFDLAVGDYIELMAFNASNGTALANTIVLSLERIGDAAFAMTNAMNQLSGDVTMTTLNTYYDGPSLTLAAGTWLLNASVLWDGVAAAFQVTGKLWNGTTVAASAGANGRATAGECVSVVLTAIVTLTSSETWKVSLAAWNGGPTIMRAAAQKNGAGNNASTLTAVKIG